MATLDGQTMEEFGIIALKKHLKERQQAIKDDKEAQQDSEEEAS